MRVIIYDDKNKKIRDHSFQFKDIAISWVSDKMHSLPKNYSIEVLNDER